MFRRWLALTGTLLLSPLAPAEEAPRETLAQKEYWANQLHYTQRTLETIKEHCGYAPEFAYDKASWWTVKDELANKGASPNGRCDDVLGAMWGICMGNPEAARAVREGIKSVVCGYGGENSGFKIELKDGVVRYQVELNRANAGEEISNYLKSQL